MILLPKYWLSLLSIALILCDFPLSATAQTHIESDGTTGSLVNGLVDTACTGGVCQITGGLDVNSSVFHSFDRFSLSSGDEAQFESSGIDRIFTRITGGEISDLDGLISATSDTDLFFLNPNGVVFGPNASLNIGGSFIGSTADSILFDNGAIFSASQTTIPNALLTINVPTGLQYGQTPGSILVEGAGNNLVINPDFLNVDRSNRPTGLQVNSGQTLALLGGPVTLRGGNITAEAGRIEVGSVGSQQEVELSRTSSGWQTQYDEGGTFDTIRLSQAASIDASGAGGGAINIQGQRLILRDGSAILAHTTGRRTGQGITIHTTNRLALRGASDVAFPSSIFSDVDLGVSGDGGPITIKTETLRLVGGQISATTFGSGNPNQIELDAQQIYLEGNPRSLLAANAPFSTGHGAGVLINTDTIELREGARIDVSNFGQGDAGDLTINAQTIDARGISIENNAASGLIALVDFGDGDGGDITLDTNTLILDEGAAILASTLSSGNAGNIAVQADTIQVSGDFADGLNPGLLGFGGIFTFVEANASGNGGSLSITANTLQLQNGARFVSGTFGSGTAGPLTIEANQIELFGNGNTTGFASAIVSQAGGGVSGDGNNIFITAGDLIVQDGGQINSNTFGSGQAGDLIIEAEAITLAGENEQGRSGLFAGAILGTGDGGDVMVTADRLLVQDGATISVSNFQSQGLLEEGKGAAGNIFLNIPIIQLDNAGLILADTAVGDEGNLTIQSDILVLSDDSRISTNAENANGGNIDIDTDAIAAFNNSDISANALAGFGGRVVVSADSIFGTAFRPFLTSDSDITASSNLGPRFDGEVVINTPDVDPSRGLIELPETLADVSEQVTAVCEQIEESSLIVTGAGSIPQHPYQSIEAQNIWPDMRLNASEHIPNDNSSLPGQQEYTNSSGVTSENSAFTPPQEAQSWWVNEQGNLILGRSDHESRLKQRLDCGIWK